MDLQLAAMRIHAADGRLHGNGRRFVRVRYRHALRVQRRRRKPAMGVRRQARPRLSRVRDPSCCQFGLLSISAGCCMLLSAGSRDDRLRVRRRCAESVVLLKQWRLRARPKTGPSAAKRREAAEAVRPEACGSTWEAEQRRLTTRVCGRTTGGFRTCSKYSAPQESSQGEDPACSESAAFSCSSHPSPVELGR